MERPGKACECGNPKVVGAYACDRCRRLEREGFSADSRPRSALVGRREEREVFGLVAFGEACDRFLRERGLIEPERWRRTNGYAYGPGRFPAEADCRKREGSW